MHGNLKGDRNSSIAVPKNKTLETSFVLEEQQRCIVILSTACIDHWVGALNYFSRLAHR